MAGSDSRAARRRHKLEKKIAKWFAWNPAALRLAERLGIDVTHYTTVHPEVRRAHLFSRLGIDTVLDVGANEGFYARGLRKQGFRGRILSFEPMKAEYARLAKRVARDGSWTAYPFALGARSEKRVIHIAGNSVSSSFLPMLAVHREAAPQSAYVGEDWVEVRRLDDVAAEAVPAEATVYLKIDVQGFEHEVLAGAEAVLARSAAVQIESSVVPLYEGQMVIEELIAYMRAHGFGLYTFIANFIDPDTRQELQHDLVFVASAALDRLGQSRRDNTAP